uniref:Dicarboxylate/tricarboxylate carrier n=1 Tax=Hirondellea gigas TaxID=1518452 RepID=A0A6A7G613_9CRUS
MSDSSLFVKIKPFVFGGLSGMFATTCIQPIDMVKVQIQFQGEKGGNLAVKSKNPFVLGSYLVRTQGVSSLYRGLSAGLVRQATYTTARLGLFRTFSNKALAPGETKLAFWKRCVCSLSAGGLAAVIGTPADVALIRMQADTTLPKESRRNYKNVFDALSKMARQDGIVSWWSGCQPTVYRAMCLNVGMLAMYDQSKDFTVSKFGPGKSANFTASAIAGFFAAFFSLPADFLKTRLQKMQALPDGTMPYKGFLDCAQKVVRNEGMGAFYQGFPTYYFRIAPHAMITLLSMELMNNFYKKWKSE